VLDIPGGHGKVPIGPDYLEPDDHVRDTSGNVRPIAAGRYDDAAGSSNSTSA
jgi:lysine 2,3-aminomutase